VLGCEQMEVLLFAAFIRLIRSVSKAINSSRVTWVSCGCTTRTSRLEVALRRTDSNEPHQWNRGAVHRLRLMLNDGLDAHGGVRGEPLSRAVGVLVLRWQM
jgi:hypothetical protein